METSHRTVLRCRTHTLKFRSNCKDLLNSFPEELQVKERTLDLAVESTLHSKTLGILLDTSQDDFYVSVPTIPIDKIPLVASAAAKVFDLMGW